MPDHVLTSISSVVISVDCFVTVDSVDGAVITPAKIAESHISVNVYSLSIWEIKLTNNIHHMHSICLICCKKTKQKIPFVTWDTFTQVTYSIKSICGLRL